MSVTDSTDTTVNPASKSQVLVTTVDSIPNNDPLASPSPRMPQQRLIANAVQDRFINIVQQWPIPVTLSNVQQSDLKQTDPAANILSDTGDTVASMNFIFQNTNTVPVLVEWCGSLFIDEVAPENRYPWGVNVAPTDWSVESYKAAYFGTGLNGNPYEVNQVNQDSQVFVVKFLGTGTHPIIVQYYWRTVVNQGGNATPTTLGQ